MNILRLKEINEKIMNDEAVILTAEELKAQVRDGKELTIEDVDVVTTGTCGVMSGTAALLHFPVGEPGLFKRAKNVYLNGVPAYPGPCPNEWLGSVDAYVYGTSPSVSDSEYGGGFLFKDLIAGKKITVEVESMDGDKYRSSTSLDKMQTAKLIGSRVAFKNYTAFTNPNNTSVDSIFTNIPMSGPFDGLSFSGCGELNPLANDPSLSTVFVGTKVLVNGAVGMVLGNGTRSTGEKPNLMVVADMKNMREEYIGGFRTADGPDAFNTISLAVPVLDEDILSNLMVLDEDIDIPVADIHGRHLPVSVTQYSELWGDSDFRPEYDQSMCLECDECSIEKACPTFAYNNGEYNSDDCYGCGYCAHYCKGNAFKMNTGKLEINTDQGTQKLKITCRQSDRQRAIKQMTQLKKIMLQKQFPF